MTSNNRHQYIVAGIEAQLFDIDRRLKALSSAEQNKLINEERDRIMAVTRIVLVNRGVIPDLGFLCGWIAYQLLKFFGFDPFKWCHFEENDNNPGFANRAFSSLSLINALEQAGQVLEENGSHHLKRISKRFFQKVTSTADVDKVANAIIAFCKCLPSARNGNDLLINVNDIKLLCVDGIKLLLTSELFEERFERLCSNPVILPSGELCWVKYEFVSNTSIQHGCFRVEKFIDLYVTIWYYWFPNESDFRQALRIE